MSNAFWRDRCVLVTGATGLLGGWLVKRLMAEGASVTTIIRDWVPQSEIVRTGVLDHGNVARGDVTDQEFVERVLAEYEIQTVFHLAAQTVVGIANLNPVSTLESNVRGTWTVLEACRRSPKVQAIVTASSDKAYGAQPVLPYSEEMPLQGRHPYDVSKSCADLIAQSYAHTFHVPVAITRCGNFYGGGDLNWNRIVPGTIRSILRKERPVIRSDGKFIRDYLYVEDGSAAYMLLAEHLTKDPSLKGSAFNFSTETPITVLELAGKILEKMSSSLKPDVRNEANNEIREQFLSAKLARERLHWKPAFTLDNGLERTIAWYKELLK